MSTAFISRAVLNHSAALVQLDKDPAKYSKAMEDFGSHHAKDEHIWGEELLQSCSFHNAKRDDGSDYHTTHPLKCPFHARAYKVECLIRAGKARRVVHPELGRGNSNMTEAAHHVALTLRQKDKGLGREAYETRMIIGLLKANQSRMQSQNQSYD